jgi:HlyD family secretion protein
VSITTLRQGDAQRTPSSPSALSRHDHGRLRGELSPVRSVARSRPRRRMHLVGVVAALVALGAAAVWLRHGRTELGAAGGPLVYYTVTRADLPITVTERGNLESQRNTEIRCDVETVPGQPGTRIVSIVPNGKGVQHGELLVEFDAAPLEDRVDSRVLSYEQAKAAQIQTTAKLENQKTQNETALAAAQLKVELAQLNLRMYEDGQDGTYQIEIQDLDLKIQEAKNQIVEAQAGMLLQRTSRGGMEMLYKLGYRGKGDLDQAVYKTVQSEDALVKATNALANAAANRRKLEEFEHPMKKLELQGGLNTARQGSLQVGRDNTSLLAQAEAAKIATDRALAKEEEKLAKYKEQLDKCKIYAPHDGMVAYSTERTPFGRPIGEGELVIERMKILSLPDLSRMQVRTMVHESVLDQVREGLEATIQIDAFPERSYRGTVQSVAVLPAQGGNFMISPDVKVYETVVTIDEEVEQLRPGMTAVVEIHVDRLDDVLSVPVQAIVQVERENSCYVEGPGGVERRPVVLGRTNDKFVEILSGLSEGDRVVLNPMAIVDPAEAGERAISPES